MNKKGDLELSLKTIIGIALTAFIIFYIVYLIYANILKNYFG